MSTLLEVKDVCKRYGKKTALDHLNLTLESGHIVGLLGPNGSGKTTLIKLINGILTPDEGEILVEGMKIGVETKKVVSYLPDHTYLNMGMRVRDILDYFEDFYQDFDVVRAYDMLAKLSINPNDKLKSMSKGTKENVNHVIDGLETLYGEDYQELMDALDLTAADFVASMREAVEEFDDSTTLVFYLYKGQYAAIDIIPENDVSFEVQFLGGDTRMQNMILLADDEKVVEVQGSNEGSVETITMIAEENDTVKFTYDSDSGDITMEAKYDEESYNFAGNLAVDKNSMVITIDDLGSASEDVSGSITWKKGAQFEEVSGDTFDLGNATEEEWQDLLHEIFAAMLGGF